MKQTLTCRQIGHFQGLAYYRHCLPRRSGESQSQLLLRWVHLQNMSRSPEYRPRRFGVSCPNVDYLRFGVSDKSQS